jgi:hypothetical protein
MFFLTMIVIGLTGLVMMAIPGLNRSWRAGSGHSGLHVGHAHSGSGGHHGSHGIHPGSAKSGSALKAGAAWHIPNPRVIFSLIAMYGASGDLLVHAIHLEPRIVVLIAAVPAILMERFAFTPFWNLLFRFQGTPAAPLDQLVLSEARAVTPFRNQKGMVSVTHNGRLVQLLAELCEANRSARVGVGDRLIIEAVDTARERVTVAVVAPDVDELSL